MKTLKQALESHCGCCPFDYNYWDNRKVIQVNTIKSITAPSQTTTMEARSVSVNKLIVPKHVINLRLCLKEIKEIHFEDPSTLEKLTINVSRGNEIKLPDLPNAIQLTLIGKMPIRVPRCNNLTYLFYNTPAKLEYSSFRGSLLQLTLQSGHYDDIPYFPQLKYIDIGQITIDEHVRVPFACEIARGSAKYIKKIKPVARLVTVDDYQKRMTAVKRKRTMLLKESTQLEGELVQLAKKKREAEENPHVYHPECCICLDEKTKWHIIHQCKHRVCIDCHAHIKICPECRGPLN